MRCLFLLLLLTTTLSAQTTRWEIAPDESSISWKVADDQKLPHGDNVEMSGRKVSMVIDYQVDEDRMVKVQRRLIYPQMRTFIKDTDPAWWATYRNYLKRNYEDEEVLPKIYLKNRQISWGPTDSITLNGLLNIYHQPTPEGLLIKRTFYPHESRSAAFERISLHNQGADTLKLNVLTASANKGHRGKAGNFYTAHRTQGRITLLLPGQKEHLYITMSAGKNVPPPPFRLPDLPNMADARRELVESLQQNLVLETPNPVYNTMFSLAKVRGAESIFDSKLGLVHSPGGERYYTGFWANDQAEYINPFFPYLGYQLGNKAALNMWRVYAKAQPASYAENIRYSFEMAGDSPANPLDRGDAAMIAYGLSHYLLALGDAAVANELWPFLEWCLEYNHRKLNAAGVVASESDEMEGRIETGDANLATSSLYYAALETSISLGEALSKDNKQLKEYATQRSALALAIETYFGHRVEGLDTYRYYKGHENLRHWIAMPLVVGLHDRKEATLTGLFDHLWTENGVHVEKNSDNPEISRIFWDRGTLYALRGAFVAGATERANDRLLSFSRERLLGERVPYVVEAYPEGNMAHLSAESGLYCRIFTEGIFGILPTGFRSFRLQPQMPKDWNKMALRKIFAFGQDTGFDIEVQRKGNKLSIRILTEGEVVQTLRVDDGAAVEIKL